MDTLPAPQFDKPEIDDPFLADEADEDLSTAAIVRKAQVARVLQLQVEENLTQKEACARLKMDEGTFRRWAKESPALEAMRREAQGTLTMGAILAMKGYLAGIRRLVKDACDPLMPVGTVLKITKELGHILRTITVVLPAGGVQLPAPVEGETAAPAVNVDFKFEGPMTLKIVQQDGVPVSGVVLENAPSAQQLQPPPE